MATPWDVEVLTADEVAALLGVNRNTVYEAARRAQIPHHQIGRRLIFERGAVLSWLRQPRVTSTKRGD